MSVREQFSEAELEAITEATRRAESRTGGELVCVVVARSDGYEEACFKAATLGALVFALGAALWRTFGAPWSPVGPLWIALPATLGAAVGLLLALSLPALRRALTAAELLDHRVANRAARAFVEESVFATRDRTGVLLFLSLFEHRVRVLCDEGIRTRVPDETWQQIADDLAAGVRARRAGTSLLAAVEACGRILEEHGVPRRTDDRDELADEPRLSDA